MDNTENVYTEMGQDNKKKKMKLSLFNNAAMKQMRLEQDIPDSISLRAYNSVLGLVLVWGLLVNYIMAKFFSPYILELNYLAVLIVFFIGSFISCFIIYKSSNPIVSFIGFTLQSFLVGILLTFFLSYYNTDIVIPAIAITGTIVAIMLIVSSIFPEFFAGLGKGLTIALLISIVVELLGTFLFRLNMAIMDYVVIVIFCGYIGFDWVKAQAYPKTIDNAIDSAADIYMDIINIFIRVLEILGRRK